MEWPLNAIERWAQQSAVARACADFDDRDAIVATAIALQQIPAPTFHEAERGAFVAQRMAQLGLSDRATDELGNVYGRRPGHGNGTGLLLAAHLDTVFPASTDLSIRREGARIYGPGLGDNSLGLAAMLHLAETMQRHNLPNDGDIWFVANVCEEGLGDLRGMRAAVDRLQDRIGTAIALEGCDQGRVFHEAIGVRRYRIVAEAPGGHSWGDFGAPSAIHALVRLGERLSRLEVPAEPRTTFNIGTLEGGTSVNTIAQRAALLLDLRSAESPALDRLVRQVEQLVAEARMSDRRITWRVEVVGDRPPGRIARSHPLVQAATAAYQLAGATISYDYGSTDANIPLSRGIPAVCVAVGDGDNAHRLDEYIDPTRLPAGMRALLWLALAASSSM
jgi:acetylornithine deacetylase/succinyl-diaminopimelate desuccinylase-like protein